MKCFEALRLSFFLYIYVARLQQLLLITVAFPWHCNTVRSEFGRSKKLKWQTYTEVGVHDDLASVHPTIQNRVLASLFAVLDTAFRCHCKRKKSVT